MSVLLEKKRHGEGSVPWVVLGARGEVRGVDVWVHCARRRGQAGRGGDGKERGEGAGPGSPLAWGERGGGGGIPSPAHPLQSPLLLVPDTPPRGGRLLKPARRVQGGGATSGTGKMTA